MTQPSAVLQPTEATVEGRRETLRHLVFLALVRLAASAAVARAGLVALSDDDYSRVAVAQRFAAHPSFDPSGTSWLPFPFWCTGVLMKLLDSSLEVGRLAAALMGIAGTWLLFAAGKRWGFSDKAAIAAAALATTLPASAVLGSATVPEFPTAALAVFGVIAAAAPATKPGSATGWLAAAAMLAATLSRYETWPVAVVVAYGLLRRSDYRRSWERFAAAALCLAGPALWILHNQLAYHDALSFFHRVASYRAALGREQHQEETSYLTAVVGGCPAIVLAAGVPTALWLVRDRAEARAYLKRFSTWAVAASAMLLWLIAGQQLGGAPTHHSERTLLFVWMLAAFVVVDLARQRRVMRWLAVPVLILFALDYREKLKDETFSRQSEELTGIHLHSLVAPGERVFIATDDYGAFAVMAAFGRPDDTIYEVRDPRAKPGKALLDDRWNAPERLKAEHASWLVVPASTVLPVALRRRSYDGKLVIFQFDPTR